MSLRSLRSSVLRLSGFRFVRSKASFVGRLPWAMFLLVLLGGLLGGAAAVSQSTPVPMPVISLPGGHYLGSQTVTITDSQAGATIYYTTDGLQPTTSSPTYSGPITISSNATVQAIAVQSGYINSRLASAVYTINTTTTALTVTGTDPYTMKCAVTGPGVFSSAGPTGQVTFSDVTTGSTLATATLGASVKQTGFRNVDTWPIAPPLGAVLLGDFDGDGKLDLITLGFKYPIAIHLGDGDGTFQPEDGIPGLDYGYLAVGDFNGDGKLDVISLISGSSTSSIEIALGNGDGTFKAVTSQSFAGDWQRLVVADVNGDGKLDLIEAGGTAGVAVFLGNGDGTFQSPVITSVDSSAALTEGFIAGDFNGDGKPDLAWNDPTAGSLSIFLGNGDGTFRPGIATPTAIGRTNGPLPAAADFNGDGHLDIAVGVDSYLDGLMLILLGNGDGTFQYQPNLKVDDLPYLSSLAAADFNGDGITDLAVARNTPIFRNWYASLLVFFGHGDGTFSFSARGEQWDTSDVAQLVFAANLNGDGRSEIGEVAQDSKGSLWWHSYVATVPRVASASSAGVTVDVGTIATHVLQCSYAGDANYQPSSGGYAEIYTKLATPVLSLLVGRYTTPQTVTISGSGSGATYYYTMDGSTPTTSSTKYTAPFVITTTTTVKAIAAGVGFITSDVSEASYTFAAAPSFSPAPGQYATAQTVTITDSTPSSSIFYTMDGTTPTPKSTQYSAAVAVPADATLKALAIAPSHLNSATTSGAYTVPSAATTTTLKASASSGTVNQTITLTATVKGSSPTGTVNFLANGTTFGSAAVSSGTATFQTKFTAAGTYSIRAQYLGDANNSGSTSSALSLVIGGADFSVAAASSSQTVKQGGTASYTLDFNPAGGYAGTIKLSCSGLPSEASCTFNPSSVQMTGSGKQTSGLSVSTTAPTAGLAGPRGKPQHGKPLNHALVWAGLFGLFFGASRIRRVSGTLRAVAFVLLLAIASFAVAACGGGSSGGTKNPGTPTGTYTVTVTGSDSAANLQHTVKLTLTVQ